MYNVILKEDWSNLEEFKMSLSMLGLALFAQICREDINHTYEDLQMYLLDAEIFGFTFDYGLDCIPFNFKSFNNVK